MERRIEDATKRAQASARVQELEPVPEASQVFEAPTEGAAARVADDEDRDLRVITREGDLAVIHDLRPDEAAPEAPSIPVAPPRHVPDGATKQRYRMLVAGHVASDIFCLNVMLLATELLDEVLSARSLSGIGWLITLASSAVWIAIFHAFGLYATMHFNSAEEIRRVVGATSVGAALLMIFGTGMLPPGRQGLLGLTFVMLVALGVLTRLAWRRYARSLRQKGLLAYRTLILGSAHDAAAVATSLGVDDRSGFFPVGRIGAELDPDIPGSPPLLGLLADAPRLVEECSIEALIVASPTLTTAELARLQQLARRERLALRLVARVPHMLTNRLTLQRVGPLMTVAVRPAELTGTQAALKRAFDISIASVGLVLSLPIQLVIGLLVRFTSPGPVLFRQQRVTRANELFTVYKFRTMDRDADRIMDERAIDRT
ncbi:MAG TPA: sugar transferase, partial [Actinomycetota bacterium]